MVEVLVKAEYVVRCVAQVPAYRQPNQLHPTTNLTSKESQKPLVFVSLVLS